MRRFSLVLPIILFTLLLAGCSSILYTPIPSPFPVDYIPTIIALTLQAGEQSLVTPSPVVAPDDTQFPPPTPTPLEISPTYGPSPTSLAYDPSPTSSPPPSATSTIDLSPTSTTSRRATRTPTITPTPTIPVADIQISEPGPMSRLVSPLHLLANLRSVPSGTYHVEVWSEPLQPGGEPRLLFREVERIISNPIPWVYLDQDISFELGRVSELGQLRVSIFDKNNRPTSINSVDLLLLSMGQSVITPPGFLTEPIVIREPTPNKLIQGGMVIVSGEAIPEAESMLVELVTTDGVVVGYRQVFVSPSPDGSYVPYAVEVPYQVDALTWVMLRISESGERIPGMQHLTSVEIWLSP